MDTTRKPAKHGKGTAGAVYQVLRQTNGTIRDIVPLQAKRTAWGVYMIVPDGSPSGNTLAYRVDTPRRGRPTVLPHHMTPVDPGKGRPPRGTIHLDSPELSVQRQVLKAAALMAKHYRALAEDPHVRAAVLTACIANKEDHPC